MFPSFSERKLRLLCILQLVKVLGPFYTKHLRQRYENSVMTLAILFSLKTMESLENGLQPQSGETPLFSVRPVALASSQL